MHSILFIENDVAVRELLRVTFVAGGYAVQELPNGWLGIHPIRSAPN